MAYREFWYVILVLNKNWCNFIFRCSAVELMKVQDIACGYGFTVFAVNNGKTQLFATGLNKDGQIGNDV